MDLGEALMAARSILAEYPADSQPLVLNHHEGAGERNWCFIVTFNGIAYVATLDFMYLKVGQGPIVIPRDGTRFMQLGSADDVDAILYSFESDHGIEHGEELEREFPPEEAVRAYWQAHPGSYERMLRAREEEC